MPVREAYDGAVHIFKKEQEEEGDGLLLHMYVCQIPP